MKQIEVQGKEIAIRNSYGDIAIIPIKAVSKVRDMIRRGCGECVDRYVMSLPKHSDYAADGQLVEQGGPDPGDPLLPNTVMSIDNTSTNLVLPIIDNSYNSPEMGPTPKTDREKFVREKAFNPDLITHGDRLILEEWYDNINDKSVLSVANDFVQYASELMADPLTTAANTFGIGDGLQKKQARNKEFYANPYASDGAKRGKNISDSAGNTAWALLNALPFEKAVGIAAKNVFKKAISIEKKMGVKTFKASDIKKLNDVVIEKDIHILRKVYHNGERILMPEEKDLLKAKGFGDKNRYKYDELGRNIHAFDMIVNEEKKASKLIFKNKNTDKFPLDKIENDIIDNTIKFKNGDFYSKEHKEFLAKKRVSDYNKTIGNIDKYRTLATKEADKYIESWFGNAETKKRFMNKGGDEKSWNVLKENIDFPIMEYRLGREYGGLNTPFGNMSFVQKGYDRSNILNVGAHEKYHQSRIVANTRETSLLPRVYEDIEKSMYTLSELKTKGIDPSGFDMPDYYIQPTEVYSNIGQIRLEAGAMPGDKLTRKAVENTPRFKRIKKFIKNKDKLIKDVINGAPIVIPFILPSFAEDKSVEKNDGI